VEEWKMNLKVHKKIFLIKAAKRPVERSLAQKNKKKQVILKTTPIDILKETKITMEIN